MRREGRVFPSKNSNHRPPVPQRIAVMPDDRGSKPIDELMRSQGCHHVRAIFVQKGQLEAQVEISIVPFEAHHKEV